MARFERIVTVVSLAACVGFTYALQGSDFGTIARRVSILVFIFCGGALLFPTVMRDK